MATFTDKDYDRLDFRLHQNGCIVLYWRRECLNEDADWLRQHGYLIDSFECARWKDERDLHEDFAKALEFPDYYGMNLNALNDCLSELQVPENGGRALIFQQYDSVVAKMPRVAWDVLDILARNSRTHLLFGRRLITLIQSDDPRLEFDPVGAQSVGWNSKEWLNKNRGL